MIGPGVGARVMIATRPVDFRKGPDALAALVGAEYGGDPFSGVIYVFRAKRSDRIKLIWWDGTGLCLMAKKLEQGGFRWPGIQDGVMRVTAAQLGALLEGLDWRRVPAGYVTLSVDDRSPPLGLMPPHSRGQGSRSFLLSPLHSNIRPRTIRDEAHHK